MDGLSLSRDLRRRGLSSDEIARLVRRGELTPIRRGAYQAGPPGDAADLRAVHRKLLLATIGQCSANLVVSHMSAAVLHALPVWPQTLDKVQFTRNGIGGGNTRRLVRVHGLPLAPQEITVVDGIPVTTMARTVVDLACQLPMQQAVAIGDQALRAGMQREELGDVLGRAVRRHGIAAARRVIAFLDARSETVGESRSRVILHEHGFPVPELQFEISDRDGWTFARTDFGWPELRTVGEFDGKVKYQRDLRPGHDPIQALYDEKKREDRIRELNLQVVRWITPDLERPTDWLERLRRAFERGRRTI